MSTVARSPIQPKKQDKRKSKRWGRGVGGRVGWRQQGSRERKGEVGQNLKKGVGNKAFFRKYGGGGGFKKGRGKTP